MSAGEYTEKLHLPIFGDNDKPTWRGDINDAHRRIETGFVDTGNDVKTATNLATSALGVANDTASKISEAVANGATAINRATEAQAVAAQVQALAASFATDVSTATETANSAIKIAEASSKETSIATIQHFEEYNGYDIIRIVGDTLVPFKKFYANNHSDGTVPRADLENPLQFSERTGYSAVIGCDAFTGFDGSSWKTATTLSPVGLQIVDGKAVQDFGVHQSSDRTGADLVSMVIKKDGTIFFASKSDGKTAAEYVSDGAWMSVGYGPILFRNGGIVPFDNTTYSGFVGTTGQTAIGRTQDGWIILIAYGVSNSSGMSVANVQAVLQTYGTTDAILLDGGGSVQATWQGALVHPSTDSNGTRGIHSFLALTVPETNEYDSGIINIPVNDNVTGTVRSTMPALSIRQIGKTVTIYFNLIVNSVGNRWKVISPPITLPKRYWSDDQQAAMKWLMCGSQGIPVGLVVQDENSSLAARSYVLSQDFSNMYVQGTSSWKAMYA